MKDVRQGIPAGARQEKGRVQKPGISARAQREGEECGARNFCLTTAGEGEGVKPRTSARARQEGEECEARNFCLSAAGQ
eukprot:1153203-Pelagomonas_calceolata.AAC.4